MSESTVASHSDNISISTDMSDFTPFQLMEWARVDEESIFAARGYKKLHLICDILQGELYKAVTLSDNKFVAIKKANKSQCHQFITIQDDFSHCTTENRLQESVILKYLTVTNKPLGDHIIKFINFFESDDDYYLVTEYVESETNLKQFIEIAQKYISQGVLSSKAYQKIIKYLLWQLAVTIYWLHKDMKCCHLDICLENIMLENCNFIPKSDGKLKINTAISIKLGDFGVAELFPTDKTDRNLKEHNPFNCMKNNLSLDNESYLAPQICKDEMYDARLADMWSFGLILYQCVTGEQLYNPRDVWQLLLETPTEDVEEKASLNNGYLALMCRKLKSYLLMNDTLKYFTSCSFDLLNNLLNMNENERMKSHNVLKHKWFDMYYKQYGLKIKAKSAQQKQDFIKNKKEMRNYQFYCATNKVEIGNNVPSRICAESDEE